MHKPLIALGTVAVLSSCGAPASGGAGGVALMCIAVEAVDEPTANDEPDVIDAYTVRVHRGSVRTAGADEQLAPPPDFCNGALATIDLIDENGRHVWFGYGAEQYGEVVDVPPLPTLTNASLDVTGLWGWGSYTHVEINEDARLVLAVHDGGLLGANGLDVVAESAGLPRFEGCGSVTEQRLRFNDELTLNNGESGSLAIDGTAYTVTNLWSTSFDNWQGCTDVSEGPSASWLAWRE